MKTEKLMMKVAETLRGMEKIPSSVERDSLFGTA